MPYQANRAMGWGPRLTEVQLSPGDEVPTPFNQNKIPHFVIEVDEVAGKKWCDQPKAAQDAWAALNDLPSPIHPSQLVTAKVEAPEPALTGLQEAAGVESSSEGEAPAPPPRKRKAKKKSTRGRQPRK